jgi:hypothetical protein
LRSLAAYIAYKLQKKEDPAPIKASKERAMKVLKNLDKLPEKEVDFFDS